MLHWKDICTCRGRPSWIGRSINVVVAAVAVTFFAAHAAAQCGPGSGDCCDANGSAGCENVACCEAVCDQDSFCCDVEWDRLCGDIAVNNCDICLGKPIPVDCPGDLTGNEVVGPMDLLALSDAWGPCANVDDCPADLNGDGFVNTFDILILLDAWGPCEDDVTPDGCGEPGTGDCCGATGTPFCEDEACCTAVCAGDPFCCDVEWDVICATGGFDPDCLLGPGQCGALNTPECDCGGPPSVPGEGDCCAANGTVGCEDPTCEADVCVQDDFCCDVEWDGLCAGIAEETCDFCEDGGAPPPSGCCVVASFIGCDDLECQALVCPDDPFCCKVQWDQLCADAANQQCEICELQGPGPGDSCCANNGTPGCEDAKCEEVICTFYHPFCCDVQWDSFCASMAFDFCDVCGGSPPPPLPRNCGKAGTGDCCEATGTPFCEDEACCSAVCDSDPFCCGVEWDGLCAEIAEEICDICDDGNGVASCGKAGTGNCCEATGTPFCVDEACCETVCAGDPFCCSDQWDADCADIAHELCDLCDDDKGTLPDSNCCTDHGEPGCEDEACEAEICAQDAFCCDVQWDWICADAALDECEVCN